MIAPFSINVVSSNCIWNATWIVRELMRDKNNASKTFRVCSEVSVCSFNAFCTICLDIRLQKSIQLITSVNVPKISVNHRCYLKIRSKSTITAPSHDRKKVRRSHLWLWLVGFDPICPEHVSKKYSFGNISVIVLISEIAYQCKRW